ncbi:MAG: isoprenoid biosynthesis glyoxalase ElbB [Opitutales bacterium]|nr:isoprenoid biosynthesis glyoxalase ElbB [Opitutales bacterium]
MKKIAVVLSGCGVFDGSEIQEAVLSLFFLDRLGVDYQCFAPNKDKAHVVNHLTGEVSEGESRNVLVESARIARGKVIDLSKLKQEGFNGVLFPGGFGAAKNLCTFAFEGDQASIEEEVERVFRDFRKAEKPMGVLCIAPVIAAKVLEAEVTVGEEGDASVALEKMGGKHVVKPVSEIHVDEVNNVITAPAYMYGEASISEVGEGIEKLVCELIDRC